MYSSSIPTTSCFGLSNTGIPYLSIKPSIFHSIGTNKEYKPLFVCPFAFLLLQSESLYKLLKFLPPLSKAFEVEPIIHLPIILLPNRKHVFVTLQLFKMFSGFSHLPLSSCINSCNFSPS